MLRQYEELAVLEQGDDGAIVSIKGQECPAVVLGASYLEHLESVAREARGELAGLSGTTSALRLLCSEIQTLLATYRETCNKYGSPLREPVLLSAALEELNALRKELGRL